MRNDFIFPMFRKISNEELSNLVICSMVFRNILVATDGSRESDKAVEVAVDLAVKLEAKVTFLHVINVPELGEVPGTSEKPDKAIRDRLMDAGKKILEKATQSSKRKKVVTNEKISFGYPADTIVKEASTLGVDLIAMGSRGTTGIRRVMIGSTAEKVLRWSNVPVLIVKEPSGTGPEERSDEEL
jgi:nucleotide-binding universal stress UspA family protein